MPHTIGNPLSWSVDTMRATSRHLGAVVDRIGGHTAGSPLVEIRNIDREDIREAVRRGWEDFQACRSDVIFLCLLYPIIGLTMAWIAFNREFLPLLFPVVSGFALIGPVAATGLYEMSRRREQGQPTDWTTAFAVTRSPSFGAIFLLGLILGAIFFVWLAAANGIHAATLGTDPPASYGAFLEEVLTTGAGWTMIIVGTFVGFLFAVLVLAMSIVSFPLLLDRDVGLRTAVSTSIRVAAANPQSTAVWGMIVAGGLVLGSLPAFLGLIVVLPVLGHATWHLYRRAVVAPEGRAQQQNPV